MLVFEDILKTFEIKSHVRTMNRKIIEERKCTSQTRTPYLQGTQNPSELETPQWSELPPTVLVRIFGCLKDVDKVKMAQVCMSWYYCFRDPSLWRKRDFDFQDNKVEIGSEIIEYLMKHTQFRFPLVVTGGDQIMKFVQNFASYLQDVKINLHISTKDIVSDWAMVSLLLDSSTLKSMDVFFFGDRSEIRKRNVDFLKPLLRLIQNHPSLEEFHIGNSYFDHENGLKVLKCLSKKCGDLNTLYLGSLFDEEGPLIYEGHMITSDILIEIKKFTKLSNIHIESVFLTEEFFFFWTLECPSLSFLKIWFTTGGYFPTNKVWQALVDTHPHLLVELHVYNSRDADPDKAILCPSIPIRYLTWDCNISFSTQNEVISFLHLLAGYHKTLKDIYMPRIWLKFKDGDVELVENVLSECRKISRPLEALKLNWESLDYP